LAPLKDALRRKFIPALLGVDTPTNDEFCLLLARGVKQGGLVIRNPVDAAPRLHQESTEATHLLVASLLDNTPLDNEAHSGCVQNAGTPARKEQVAAGKTMVEQLSQQGGPKATKQDEGDGGLANCDSRPIWWDSTVSP